MPLYETHVFQTPGPRQLKKAHWKSETNSVQDKMQSENVFPMVGNFFFGLNFVSDYIPQLYCMQIFNI